MNEIWKICRSTATKVKCYFLGLIYDLTFNLVHCPGRGTFFFFEANEVMGPLLCYAYVLRKRQATVTMDLCPKKHNKTILSPGASHTNR